MSIERLGPVDPIQRYSQAEKAKRNDSKPESDSVSFSDEAKLKAEVYRIAEEVKTASDVRMDRVEEVRKKLQDPNYIDNAVVENVAEHVMDMFGL